MTGYEGLRSDAAWIDLSGRGEVRVTGEDRARLLHAMSTNHVQGLAEHQGLYAFFLSAQGRILADSYVYNLGDALLLDTEPQLRNKLREHLDKYIIADDAYLEDETDRWAVIALEGPKSIELAIAADFPIPDRPLGVADLPNGLVVRVASSSPVGLRFFVPASHKAEFLERFRSIPQASAEETRAVRIENGVPRYGEEVSERYLVQETGVLSAVHSNKGCYLGQEIVERVRSRAQVHRNLQRIWIETDAPPVPGTKLASEEGKDVGEIVSSVHSPAHGKTAAFAYVRTEALEPGKQLQIAGSQPAVSVTLG